MRPEATSSKTEPPRTEKAALRTHVYVDGFNLYYGCAQYSTWKWLDVGAWCRRRFPQNQIKAIKYFTAEVSPRAGSDPKQRDRQREYLRALRASGVHVQLGHFLTKPKTLPVAATVPGWKGYAGGKLRFEEVMNTEEKGSDVNLATHLVLDASRGAFDMAVLITNDSDLSYPVHVVRRELRLRVGVLAPILSPDTRSLPAGYRTREPSVTLRKTANYFWLADAADLTASQFPQRMHDKDGPIVRPAGW